MDQGYAVSQHMLLRGIWKQIYSGNRWPLRHANTNCYHFLRVHGLCTTWSCPRHISGSFRILRKAERWDAHTSWYTHIHTNVYVCAYIHACTYVCTYAIQLGSTGLSNSHVYIHPLPHTHLHTYSICTVWSLAAVMVWLRTPQRSHRSTSSTWPHHLGNIPSRYTGEPLPLNLQGPL